MQGPYSGISTMKGCLITITLGLTAAFVLRHAHALNALETCQIVKNGTYIADPTDCQGWAFCLNGRPIFGKCDEGLLYSSASGTCDYASSVSCYINTSTLCIGLTNVYKADPYNCTNFCYCKNGSTYSKSCPTGQYYDPVTVSCVWSDSSTCVPNSPCLLAQNGFVKDTSSCDGWFRCAGGQVVDKGNCPAGYYYSASKGICDYTDDVQCASSPSAPLRPVPPTDACSTKPSGANGTAFYIAQENSCRGYFYCPEVNSTNAAWGECPKGTNFDVATQTCTDPYNVPCTANRCDGVSNTFMAVAGTGCKEYMYCSNNQISAKSTCPVGHPYLNEVTGTCDTVQSSYNICTAKA